MEDFFITFFLQLLKNRFDIVLISKGVNDMKLAYKNTEYKLKINLTNNKIGLLNDDVWCNVILNITNKEFNYHTNRQSLSKNELEKILKTIKECYYNKEKVPKLLFIKNYFIIKCYNRNTDKYKD